MLEMHPCDRTIPKLCAKCEANRHSTTALMFLSAQVTLLLVAVLVLAGLGLLTPEAEEPGVRGEPQARRGWRFAHIALSWVV